MNSILPTYASSKVVILKIDQNEVIKLIPPSLSPLVKWLFMREYIKLYKAFYFLYNIVFQYIRGMVIVTAGLRNHYREERGVVI